MDEAVRKRYDPLVYELLKERFFSEWDRIDALDQKANNSIGFSGIILSFISAAGVYFIQYMPKTANLYSLYSFLFLSGVSFLVFSIVLALKACSVEIYMMFPEPDKFLNEARNVTRDEMLEALPEAYAEFIKSNKLIIDNKAKYISYSHKVLFIGILLNTIFIMSLIFLKS